MWWELTKAVSRAPADNRLQAAEDWLKGYRKASKSSSPPRSGWEKNQDRDTVIDNGLLRGTSRGEICRQLDKRMISVIDALEKLGLHKWADGWADRNGRRSIQSLFTKRAKRLKHVKPPDTSI